MSIEDKPLSSRLNQLDSDKQVEQQIISEVDPRQTSLSFDEEPHPVPDMEETTFVDTEPQKVAVNPLKIIEFFKKPVDPALVKRAENVKGDDEYLIIPNATEADFDAVMSKKADQSITAKPGNVKYNKKLDDYGKFNVNFIEDSDGVKQFINAVGEVYQGEKTFRSVDDVVQAVTGDRYIVYKDGKIAKKFDSEKEANTFIDAQKDKELFSIESKAPYSKEYITKLLDPKNPTIADPEEAYRMLITQLDVTNRAEMLARKLIDAEAAGKATDAMRVEFDQTLALAGEISKAVERRQADYGRSLRMFGEMRKSDGGQQMKEFIEQHGGSVGAEDRARKFLAIEKTEDKVKMASRVFDTENAYRLTKDIWISTWINGLLSGPTTHLRNITSNALFGIYQTPEMLATSIVGKVRKGVFGGEDYMKANEVLDFAEGYFGSIIDGVKLGGKAFKQNRSLDGSMSKLEYDKMANRDEFDVIFGDSKFAKSSSNALRMYGKFITMPGRALLAEDEFFKALGYMGEMKLLTRRQANKFYKDLLAKGTDAEEAQRLTTDYLTQLRKDPPKDIMEAATAKSKELTFTKELEGFLGDFQKFTNANNHPVLSPILKSFFPFVRTPTNLVIEAMKRSPAAWMLPSFRKAIKQGGVEADAAIAKATLGSTMIGTMSYFGVNGNLTGSGPTNLQQRKTLEATGWQPYSIVFSKDELTSEEIEEYRTMTPVTVGDDKIYVSYQGLQPVSTLLAIGATVGEFNTYSSHASVANRNTTFWEDVDNIALVGTMAMYNVVSELPMLQGYTEMTDILSGDPTSKKGALKQFLRKAAKKGSDVLIGGSPFGAYSGLMNTIQRSIDPGRVSQLPEDPRVADGVISNTFAAFQDSLTQYTSKNPFFDNQRKLPILDPLTGEEVSIGKNWGASFNPYKTSEGNVHEAYRALLRNGVPVYNPPRSIEGYDLSAEQYHEWIKIATIDQEVADQIIDQAFLLEGEEDLGLVQRTLRSTMTKAYAESLKELKEYYPDLEDYLEGKDEEMITEGLYSYY